MARQCANPVAIEVILTLAGNCTSTGPVEVSLFPRPNWPISPRPNAMTVPSAVFESIYA